MIKRRFLLKLAFLAGTAAPLARPAFAQDKVKNGTPPALIPHAGHDQSTALQQAIDAAARGGGAVNLPAGRFLVGAVKLRAGTALRGTPGSTVLAQAGDQPILIAEDADNLLISDIVLDGRHQPLAAGSGLVTARRSKLRIERTECRNSTRHGLALEGCAGAVASCQLHHIAEAGIFALDSQGLHIDGNHLADIGNNAVQIWRRDKGEDGTILSHNRIARVAARGGGNGQNGNGINIFRAGAVTVSANDISDCAFSGIRNNSGSDCIITANQIRGSGEVALFVEFAFEGANVSNNVIDGAAAGISLTNFDQGGRLATIIGNIVRNIAPRSAVNADTKPYGIAVEADATLIGNTVENVPGPGLQLGWGRYLRNVTASANVVRRTLIGIGVSMAEGAGTALICDNIIAESSKAALAGMAWDKIITGDLAQQRDGQWRNVSLARNRAG